MSKVCLLLPFGDVCKESYFSMISLVSTGKFDSFVDTNNSLPKCRNSLTDAFLKSDAEWALWIDSDQVFSFQNVRDLLATPGKIVSARIMARRGTFLCGMRIIDDPMGRMQTVFPSEEGVVTVDACGFGMLKVHREVHEKMREKHGYHQFQELLVRDSNKSYSEDIVWTRWARELGYKIYFNHNVKVAHYGGLLAEEEVAGNSNEFGSVEVADEDNRQDNFPEQTLAAG